MARKERSSAEKIFQYERAFVQGNEAKGKAPAYERGGAV
jgi:hypothetical protein